MTVGENLTAGAVVWASLSPTRGREQAGHRPVLVVASPGYLATVETLAIVVPITTVDRGWPNHVPLTGPHGLSAPTSMAMTEQVRVISRGRVGAHAGRVDNECLTTVRVWLGDFLDVPLGAESPPT